MESRRGRAILSLFFAMLATAGQARADGGTGAIDSLGTGDASPLASSLPQEAPSSLFDAKLGKGPDDDAVLTVSGSWSATTTSSLAYSGTS